jgi:hypothetical protein
MAWVYKCASVACWQVGWIHGHVFEAIIDADSEDEARRTVHFLNGGDRDSSSRQAELNDLKWRLERATKMMTEIVASANELWKSGNQLSARVTAADPEVPDWARKVVEADKDWCAVSEQHAAIMSDFWINGLLPGHPVQQSGVDDAPGSETVDQWQDAIAKARP